MSQPLTVLSFRKRLRKRGYTQVRITRCPSGNYLVSAFEPLASFPVQREMDISDISSWR